MGTSATSSRAASPAAAPTDGAFRPAWWCRNPHLQTLWGPLFRRDRLPLRRERVATRDGDFVDLDWADGPAGAPLLLVLHGLQGSARSPPPPRGPGPPPPRGGAPPGRPGPAAGAASPGPSARAAGSRTGSRASTT